MISSGVLLAVVAVAAVVLVAFGVDRATHSQIPRARALSLVHSVAIALAVVPTLWLLVFPPWPSGGGTRLRLWLILPVLMPVAIAALPMVIRRPMARALMCGLMGLVMAAFCIVLVFSIGLVFVPAALMLLIAALTVWFRQTRGGAAEPCEPE